MKLQAVMENLHRQQRAKLLMELEQQQSGALQGHCRTPTGAGNERIGSPAAESEHAQMTALAAMRAVAAGLQRASDSSVSERSSVGEDDEEEEDDDDDDEEEGGEEQYKDMMGSEEEEQIKQKWHEEDFEGEIEEDYAEDLVDEGLPTGREAVAPGKGILLLPHRHLHPHSQLLKPPRPSTGIDPDREPRVAVLPPHGPHSQQVGQDHGDWTYEEQFRQLYELDGDPKRKEFLDDLFSFMQKRGTPVNRIPIMAKQVLDLYTLYQLVTEKGGLVEVINKKLWREITKGLNLPTSITSAAFTLRTQYMKYLYPYECDKRSLSNPNELQAAIDSNRREGRRQSFGSSLFTYSPNGTPTMLSSPKMSMQNMGMSVATNGGHSLTPIPRIKKEEEAGQPASVMGHVPGHSLAGHSAAAVQAAMVAQVAALEQLRDKLEAGEPPEKKMALPAEEHQRLLQRALQHNLLAMTAQVPMNIRINSQGVLFAQAAGSTSSGTSGSSFSNKAPGARSGPQAPPHTPTSVTSTNPLS
uniref:AT-rich interactive domain-containing protein 3 n=1 Tax=Esox lucius TaxID=8010 RepID=A0A3P8ZUU3_ESOLU